MTRWRATLKIRAQALRRPSRGSTKETIHPSSATQLLCGIRVQQPGQTVERHTREMQKKSIRANISDEQTRFAIINGLRTAIKHAVLQHEPTNVSEIKKWATLAESAENPGESRDVIKHIQRLEEKFDKFQIREVSATAQQRGRTPSPAPRVTFAENARSGIHYPRRCRHSFESAVCAAGITVRVVLRHNFYQRGRGHGRGGFRGQWNSRGRGHGRFVGGVPFAGQQQQTGLCFRCGNTRDHNNFNCPAMGAQCANCQKFNHFQSVCRSQRRATGQQQQQQQQQQHHQQQQQ